MKYFLILILVLSSFLAVGQEEILDYRSHIVVNKDRSLTVTETIRIRVEGNMIKRGIFRDIPNAMLDENGDRVKSDLEFKEVLMNGEAVNWTVDGISDGKLKIGSADILLDPGIYTYTFTYTMGDQVRFFEDYDEVYWNVTGNQWAFPIRESTATLVLPEGAEIQQHAGYSGGYGESGCACTGTVEDGNRLVYTLTGPLNSYEGFTISVGFTKGIIPPPSKAELQRRKIQKFLPLLIMVSGLLLIVAYYLFAWTRVGKDPAKGVIIARFEAPEGYSPAATRYVHRMGFDNKAFAASVVSMAVKGYLRIDKTGKNYELLKLQKDESILSPGEKKIAQKLFKSGKSFTIKQNNHSTISSAILALRSQLKKDFRKINFNKNKGWLVPGILLSIATFIITLVFLVDYMDQFTTLIITFFVSLFFFPVTIGLVKTFRTGNIFRKITVSLIVTFLAGGASFVLFRLIVNGVLQWHFVESILPYIILFLCLVGVNILFDYLIQAPTVMGRKKMDEIEGLKMYMEIAEKHRLDKLNPPKETPQLFEALLPFAIALGVENAWSERFHSIIEKAIETGEYNPGWYVGAHSFNNVGRMSRDLGSNFSSSISSASVSPQSSSSSGSGGGGFSGGGGGGGGGGGW